MNTTPDAPPPELDALARRFAGEGWHVTVLDVRGNPLPRQQQPAGKGSRRWRLLAAKVVDSEGRALGCLVLDGKGLVRVLGPWEARVAGPEEGQ